MIRYHRVGGNIPNFNFCSCKSLTSDMPGLCRESCLFRRFQSPLFTSMNDGLFPFDLSSARLVNFPDRKVR